MPTLTIGGVAPLPVSPYRHQPPRASAAFGYALIRLIESAYLAGAAAYKCEKRAAWLDAHKDHPLWAARVTEYDLTRREMLRHEEQVQKWCGALDVESQRVTQDMIEMAVDAYGEELAGLRTTLRQTAARGLCWHKLETWMRDRDGQARLPIPPGEECPF